MTSTHDQQVFLCKNRKWETFVTEIIFFREDEFTHMFCLEKPHKFGCQCMKYISFDKHNPRYNILYYNIFVESLKFK